MGHYEMYSQWIILFIWKKSECKNAKGWGRGNSHTFGHGMIIGQTHYELLATNRKRTRTMYIH